jgi:hypothetical protein
MWEEGGKVEEGKEVRSKPCRVVVGEEEVY